MVLPPEKQLLNDAFKSITFPNITFIIFDGKKAIICSLTNRENLLEFISCLILAKTNKQTTTKKKTVPQV